MTKPTLRVVEIKKEQKSKKTAKSFDKKGYVKKPKQKKEVPSFASLIDADNLFNKAYELAGLPKKSFQVDGGKKGKILVNHADKNKIRQYGKWRRKVGLAYSFKRAAQDLLSD